MCDSHDIEYVDFIWLVVSTPLKIMNVSWDYYSQYTESHKSHVPNHQPVMELCWKVLKYLEKTNISGNLLCHLPGLAARSLRPAYIHIIGSASFDIDMLIWY